MERLGSVERMVSDSVSSSSRALMAEEEEEVFGVWRCCEACFSA